MASAPAQLAALESLPTEIIQRIHVESMEVNLARVSIVIGQAVSCESIFTRFLIQAFWNDPQQCFRDPHFHWNSAYLDLPFESTNYSDFEVFRKRFNDLSYQNLGLGHQKRLQSQVLSCRWFNVRRLERIFPDLLAMTMATAHYQYALASHGSVDALPDGRLPCVLASTIPGFATEISCCLRPDRAKDLCTVDSLTVQAVYLNPVHGRSHLIRTLRVFHLPDRVLKGPWTGEQELLLILLRRGFGKRFKWHDKSRWTLSQRLLTPSFSEAACLEGIATAIYERNHHVLRYLLEIIQTFGPCTSSSRPQLKLPTSLFVMAVEHCPNRPIFLQLLIQANGNTLPYHDALRGWAFDASRAQQELAGAVKAYFLLQDPLFLPRYRFSFCNIENRILPRRLRRQEAQDMYRLDLPWSMELLLDSEPWL